MKQIFKKYALLLPAFVMACLCVFSAIEIFSGRLNVNSIERFYITITIVLINFVSFFIVRSFYKYILLATLILGLFNLINFVPYQTEITMRVNSIEIKFQTITFLICIFTYFVNFKKTNKNIYNLLYPPLRPIAKLDPIKQREQIEKVKERYAKYTNEELQIILTENKLMEEALMAASELLTERQKIQ